MIDDATLVLVGLIVCVLALIKARYTKCPHHENTFWSPASYDRNGNVSSWRRVCLHCGEQQVRKEV